MAPAAAIPSASPAERPAAAEEKSQAPKPETQAQPTGGASLSASSPQAASSSQPSQSPGDILTAPRVAFLIDYPNSEAKTKAQAACEKEPKHDDPAIMGACLQKARKQFLPDVLVFQKDKKDHVTLTIYKRNDSELKEVYVAPVAFADATDTSVKLKFKGGGSGQRPLFRNTNSPTLNLPNDYSLEIDDPEFGNLKYDAKIGLVGK